MQHRQKQSNSMNICASHTTTGLTPSPVRGGLERGFFGGERVWKLTGQVQQMQIGGGGVVDVVDLNNKTLYASPYLVYNEQGYSKHYYAGAERVSSRIGGGMQNALVDPLNSALAHLSDHDNYAGITSGLQEMMLRNTSCVGFNSSYLSMDPHLHSIEQSIHHSDPEPNWYIYHSDHLGSSSFLTDASGDPTQHLQYMPFGETFVEQRSITSYYTPYTFSAKERDLETGYSYFGARYYDADISVWLSVDPMAHQYPYQTGYCYVGLRPIMVVDPNGMWEQDADGNWVAKKGDNAWSLHKHAGISYDEAKKLMKDQGFKFSNDDKHVHVNVGDVVKIPGAEKQSSESEGGGSRSTSQAASSSPTNSNIPNYSEMSFNKSGFNNSFTMAEGVGIAGGFFYDLNGKVFNNEGLWQIYASASAWAPFAEMQSDRVSYYATLTVYENGERLYSDNLKIWNPNIQRIGKQNFTYIGNGYMVLPSSGKNISVEVSINYCTYKWWNGHAYPMRPYIFSIKF
jgi:RHS repeat-associated protein